MKITKEEFLIYYEQGLNDSEISKISGDCESTINKLRHSLNLPANGRKVITDKEFEILYQKGLNDHQIAAITGASTSQIMRRRNKFNLPVNKKKNPLDDVFIDLYSSGNNDLDIAKITGISKTAIQNYRSKLNLPAIGKHNIDKDKLMELFNSGKSDEEIGKELNRAAVTIAKQRQFIRLLRANKTPNNYEYNNEEFQVILGSLLGDGSLVKTYKNGGTILKITHSLKQRDYLEYKWNILKNNSSEIKEYTFYDERRQNPTYSNISFYTKSSLSLNEMYYNWYRPTKTINEQDLYKIEALGIAIWYMDDGYKCNPYGGAMLCTNCFSKYELEIIQKVFLDKFNIKVTLNSQNNLVYIPSSEFDKFEALIKPYVIPSMEYKLMRHYKTPLNGEHPKMDNPVLNPQEIEENAERLEVMPNE